MILIYYILINTAAFIIYGLDKRKAIQGAWRIPERTLLLLAAAGGGIGAFLGMQLFRHKTRHIQFQLLVPVCIILHLALWIMFFR